MKKFPLKFVPGIVKTESVYSQEGRYVDCDKVRFLRERPEKIGGHAKFSETKFTGTCRSLFAWDDLSLNNFVAVGTECKLEIYKPNTTKIDITPIRATGTLGADPFDTVISTSVVTVAHSSHGVAVGDTVNFSGAAAVGGLTIDGDYIVQSRPTTDTYTIDAGSNATSTATGGGASVTYSYELECGLLDVTIGGGFGVGPFGLGTYGTVRTDTNFVQLPRVWILDNYGKDLLAMPVGGKLYEWDPDVGGRAVLVANAPVDNSAFFVADDRHVIMLGAGGDPMKVQWPDQNDNTDWIPAVSNTANSRTLGAGSRLIAGTVLSNLVNLIWSDTACYAFQRTSSQAIFAHRVKGTNCGLLGPLAFTVVDGAAFWMSGHDFHMYAGYVRDIPNAEDVRDWVLTNITRLQDYKTFCGYNARYNEVWWFFVPEGETEPRYYVAVNIDSWWWINGTFSRTAWGTRESGDKRPIAAGFDGYVHTHETGKDADGAAMEAFIKTAPSDIGDGDRTMDIFGFFPDFQRQVGDVSLEFETYDYPNDGDTPHETTTDTIAEDQGTVDLYVEGRQAAFTLRSNAVGGDFRVGKSRVEIQPAGGRR